MLNAIVLTIPRNKAANSVLEPGLRAEIEVAAKLAHISPRFHKIAALRRQERPNRLATERGLEQFDKAPGFHRVVIADIVDPPRGVAARRVRRSTGPRGIAGGRPVDQAD